MALVLFSQPCLVVACPNPERPPFVFHSYLLLERDFERDLDLDRDQDLVREREDLDGVADDLLRLSCGIREGSFCLAGLPCFSPRSHFRLRLNSTKIVVIPCRHLEM